MGDEKPKFEFSFIFKQILQELPEYPSEYEVKQELTPPFCFQLEDKDKTIIGVQPPKPPPEKQ